MPTKINVMFDNFNIQTWKQFLVTLKKNTWFTEKTCKTNTKKQTKQTHTKNTKNKHTKKQTKQTHKKTNKKQKNRKKKYEKKQIIYESRIFVE